MFEIYAHSGVSTMEKNFFHRFCFMQISQKGDSLTGERHNTPSSPLSFAVEKSQDLDPHPKIKVFDTPGKFWC